MILTQSEMLECIKKYENGISTLDLAKIFETDPHNIYKKLHQLERFGFIVRRNEKINGKRNAIWTVVP